MFFCWDDRATYLVREEIDNPLYADERNFYKVEKWTKDDAAKVEQLLYAGNNLDKANEIFAAAVKHGPRTRLTIKPYNKNTL
jgi:hypothetical protein